VSRSTVIKEEDEDGGSLSTSETKKTEPAYVIPTPVVNNTIPSASLDDLLGFGDSTNTSTGATMTTTTT